VIELPRQDLPVKGDAMSSLMRARSTAVLSVPLVSGASAQETKSAALARQLAAVLAAAKLDSVAAKDPDQPDRYVAALYLPDANSSRFLPGIRRLRSSTISSRRRITARSTSTSRALRSQRSRLFIEVSSVLRRARGRRICF